MKHDSKTYNDRKERHSGMTADQASQPDKVLFLPSHIFCFLIANSL
jgi:hypothetical protein